MKINHSRISFRAYMYVRAIVCTWAEVIKVEKLTQPETMDDF